MPVQGSHIVHRPRHRTGPQCRRNRPGLGIEQVSEAVSQMDIVTQQNAALVEESAAAAKSIGHQAGQLLETVSTFKLEAGHRLNYHSALAGA